MSFLIDSWSSLGREIFIFETYLLDEELFMFPLLRESRLLEDFNLLIEWLLDYGDFVGTGCDGFFVTIFRIVLSDEFVTKDFPILSFVFDPFDVPFATVFFFFKGVFLPFLLTIRSEFSLFYLTS